MDIHKDSCSTVAVLSQQGALMGGRVTASAEPCAVGHLLSSVGSFLPKDHMVHIFLYAQPPGGDHS